SAFPSSGDVTILRSVRRIAVVLLALAFVPAAHASGPAVSIQASATSGPAPLSVTLTASGDPALYHWDLGDGTTADGPVVTHIYPAGRFVAPGLQYTVRYAGATSNAVVLRVRPGLDTAFHGTGQVGRALSFAAHEHPAGAGKLKVIVYYNGHLLGQHSGQGGVRVKLR